ncbi:MAG: C40 family peptidase [Rhizobiaceae bacterium]|nr:C40 family peptidase [Rhizobiaceae bacterium]
MTDPDRRLNAYRPDLADIRLKGKVEAANFVAGDAAEITVAVADLAGAPEDSAGVDHQLLMGDPVTVFERKKGWAWVQSARDGYVGYVRQDVLGAAGSKPTHIVAVPRSFAYPTDDLKSAPVQPLSMGCAVRVTGETKRRGTAYAALSTGQSAIADHLEPFSDRAGDYVAVAEKLEHAPYLWGGTSGFGVDCSGLVHLAMRMAGRDVPRDTDMQERALGHEIDPGPDMAGLRRGDLVFWNGHVAIMTDGINAIHASGRSMLVTREPIADAVARIAALYGPPTRYRRP